MHEAAHAIIRDTFFSTRERKRDKIIHDIFRDYHRVGDVFFRYAKTRFLVVAVQFTPSRDQTRQERVLEGPLGRTRKCCSSHSGPRRGLFWSPLVQGVSRAVPCERVHFKNIDLRYLSYISGKAPLEEFIFNTR